MSRTPEQNREIYQRRVERAKAEGFAGYGQKERARKLGYTSPTQYGGARSLAKALRVAVAPATVTIKSVGGVAYAAASGATVAGRDVGQDLGATMTALIRGGLTDDRILLPGQRSRGFTKEFVQEWLDEHDGDWDAFVNEFDTDGSA